MEVKPILTFHWNSSIHNWVHGDDNYWRPPQCHSKQGGSLSVAFQWLQNWCIPICVSVWFNQCYKLTKCQNSLFSTYFSCNKYPKRKQNVPNSGGVRKGSHMAVKSHLSIDFGSSSNWLGVRAQNFNSIQLAHCSRFSFPRLDTVRIT